MWAVLFETWLRFTVIARPKLSRCCKFPILVDTPVVAAGETQCWLRNAKRPQLAYNLGNFKEHPTRPDPGTVVI